MNRKNRVTIQLANQSDCSCCQETKFQFNSVNTTIQLAHQSDCLGWVGAMDGSNGWGAMDGVSDGGGENGRVMGRVVGDERVMNFLLTKSQPTST